MWERKRLRETTFPRKLCVPFSASAGVGLHPVPLLPPWAATAHAFLLVRAVRSSLWSADPNWQQERRKPGRQRRRRGGGDGDEDGSTGALRNSPRPHRRPAVPRRRLPRPSCSVVGSPGCRGREGKGTALGWASDSPGAPAAPGRSGGAGAAVVGVGWHKQWIRLWPLPAWGDFGGPSLFLDCFCPLGCGGVAREEGRMRNPWLERSVEVGSRVGRLFAWPSGRWGVVLKSDSVFFSIVTNFDFCFRCGSWLGTSEVSV